MIDRGWITHTFCMDPDLAGQVVTGIGLVCSQTGSSMEYSTAIDKPPNQRLGWTMRIAQLNIVGTQRHCTAALDRLCTPDSSKKPRHVFHLRLSQTPHAETAIQLKSPLSAGAISIHEGGSAVSAPPV